MPNQLPIVSIVTPSFKQGKFIKRTLDSIFCQAGDFYLDLQVYDAVSDDGTKEILEEFNKFWSEGKVVSEVDGVCFRSQFTISEWNGCEGIAFRSAIEKDKGQSDCINKGWKRMVGDFYAYMNSDDIYYPGAISRVLEASRVMKDVNVFYGAGLHIDTDDKVHDLYQGERYSLERMKAHCIICQPTVFLRKAVYEKYGGVREDLNLCMDYEYWLRLHNEKFYMIPNVQAATRLHLEAKTVSQGHKIMREICRMQKETIGVASSHWINNLAEWELSERYHQIYLRAGYAYKRRFFLNLIVIQLQWRINRKCALQNFKNIFMIILERYAL